MTEYNSFEIALSISSIILWFFIILFLFILILYSYPYVVGTSSLITFSPTMISFVFYFSIILLIFIIIYMILLFVSYYKSENSFITKNKTYYPQNDIQRFSVTENSPYSPEIKRFPVTGNSL